MIDIVSGNPAPAVRSVELGAIAVLRFSVPCGDTDVICHRDILDRGYLE